jgi:hypothetical protein
MSQIAERVRARIQDPRLTTTVSKFSPRRGELYPPAPPLLLEATEARLGFRLPPLLRELYTEVANGGFGPGYGIFGLEGGFSDPVISMGEGDGTLLDWYSAYRGTDGSMPELKSELDLEGGATLFIDPEPKPGTWSWFDKLVPICHHGDWQVSCINCGQASYPVFFYDGQQCQLRPEGSSFEEWIEAWLTEE